MRRGGHDATVATALSDLNREKGMGTMVRRNGFTLIELVVVIMILGILAGVAAPKLLSTSGTATDNGIKQTLTVVRDAIELYTAKYGQIPACTATGSDFKGHLQSYIRIFPTSPVGTKDADIKPSTTTPLVADNSEGWMYNTLTGEFICNSTATSSVGGAYSSF
jgi:prepilin-type N-terminal cleavage/methylation domain-containing protein